MSRAEKIRARLEALEAEFFGRLVSNLKRVAAGSNTLFFVSPASCPPGLPRHCIPQDTVELSALADEILELRRTLGQPDRSPALLFRRYLERAASGDENELGPIRMATAFLAELDAAV